MWKIKKKGGVVWVNNPVVNFGIVRRSNLTKVIYIYFTQKKTAGRRFFNLYLSNPSTPLGVKLKTVFRQFLI